MSAIIKKEPWHAEPASSIGDPLKASWGYMIFYNDKQPDFTLDEKPTLDQIKASSAYLALSKNSGEK